MSLDLKFKHSYVYKITNIITNEYYIGISSCNEDPQNHQYFGSGIRICNSVKKHGKSNFKKEILEIFNSRELASISESKYVTEETLLDPLCLNLKTGGEYLMGVKHAKEVGLKISKSIQKAYTENPEYGKKLSESVKRAYAENPEYGKRISEMRKRVCADPTHIEKVSNARKKLFKETNLSEKLKLIFATPEVWNKKSNSIKKYLQTEQGKINISNATKDTIYINKDGKVKRINPNKLDYFLCDGWILGNTLSPSLDTRIKLKETSSNRKWIFNEILMQNLKVKEDKLQTYLDQGWKKGHRKWNKNS